LENGSTAALIVNNPGLDEAEFSVQGTGRVTVKKIIHVNYWIGNYVSLLFRLDILETRRISFLYRELNYTISVILLLI
jgi:hypothetical protein